MSIRKKYNIPDDAKVILCVGNISQLDSILKCNALKRDSITLLP